MDNTKSMSTNRAKPWQIALFPFNNAATNVYFAFYAYFNYFALVYLTGSEGAALVGAILSTILAQSITTFSALFAPLMRVFDGITDPIVGGMLDKTKTKFGKFRPYMVIGNVLLAISVILMMIVSRVAPYELGSPNVLRWVFYIVSYVIYVIGYTCQCACTKAGQTCLTNDPKQRSQFVIWNMVGTIGSIVLINVLAGGVLTNESICPKGLIVSLADPSKNEGYTLQYIQDLLVSKNIDITRFESLFAQMAQYPEGTLFNYNCGAYLSMDFYNIMVPIVVGVSAIYTAMAVAAIAEKDKPEFWGITEAQPKLKDYADIIKGNKEMRWLVISAGFNKLASTVSISAPVMCMLYGSLMNDYNGLYLPFYALCFVFMAIFFVWGSKTAGEKGQKRGVAQFTVLAFLFFVGVLTLLCLYVPDTEANNGNPLVEFARLQLFEIVDGKFRLTINAYTILFIIFYGCGYGAFNCCDQLTIPMVADCTDYETYRSGKYVPGIMGTIFSFVDKLISSLQTLLIQIFVVLMVPGLNGQWPGDMTGYSDGMKLSTIICFCLLPMAAWIITTLCMTRYSLSGKRLQEIQAVNAVRKVAVQGGMSMEEAMKTWQTIDQVPERFVHQIKESTKVTILDKIYNAVFTKTETVSGVPSSNAIEIPEQYRK